MFKNNSTLALFCKQVTQYVVDSNSNLAQVVAELDANEQVKVAYLDNWGQIIGVKIIGVKDNWGQR